MIETQGFNIFGSEDSTDIDIMFRIEKMPCLGDCQDHCFAYDLELSKDSPKEVNSNLCVVVDGIVTDVYKGTVDEVNNMLFYTYDNHRQTHQKFVTRTVPRDVTTKANRALRDILSHLSRTSYRDLVKAALKGSMADRIEAVRKINFDEINDLNKKDGNINDYYKILAFQIGQTAGLIEGMEFYSKSSLSTHYPHLRVMLYRLPFDIGVLNYIVDEFLDLIESKIDHRETIFEVLKR